MAICLDGCVTAMVSDRKDVWAFLFLLLLPHVIVMQLIWWMGAFADGKHPGCDASYFGRREFSYTLENDIYLRFQSFNSAAELENSIKDKCPFKIDIGPVYSVDVRFCRCSLIKILSRDEFLSLISLGSRHSTCRVLTLLLFLLVIWSPHVLQPAKRHAYAQKGDNVFTPVERELIFDVVRVSTSNPKWNLQSADTIVLLTFFI